MWWGNYEGDGGCLMYKTIEKTNQKYVFTYDGKKIITWHRKCKDGTWEHDFREDNPYEGSFCEKCYLGIDDVMTPTGGFIQ